MSWPTPQDYVEAVQNPGLAFNDHHLKTGCAITTPLGLPKVISGRFACVFRFQSGSKTWAVRCFIRDFPDLAQRYNEISKSLQLAKFPFTVDFQFQKNGIRIRGQWYPIIKMQWLSGKLLGDFISENVQNKDALQKIARQMVEIYNALIGNGIAHGDLQHGNIIVVSNKLYLIDYDGMFVPSLAGRGSHEIGHPNYQHPFRKDSDFNNQIDKFSIWVIYASLLVLYRDPTLWDKLKGGDDNIIFRADDFKEPNNSDALKVLRSHSDWVIRQVASLVQRMCYVAKLDDILPFSPEVFSPQPAINVATSPQPSALKPEWLYGGQVAGRIRSPSPGVAIDTQSNFNLSQVWARILAIESPGAAPEIWSVRFQVTPKPLPAELSGIFGFLKFERHKEERGKRQVALYAARQEMNLIIGRWKAEAGDSKFQAKLNDLRRLNAQ